MAQACPGVGRYLYQHQAWAFSYHPLPLFFFQEILFKKPLGVRVKKNTPNHPESPATSLEHIPWSTCNLNLTNLQRQPWNNLRRHSLALGTKYLLRSSPTPSFNQLNDIWYYRVEYRVELYTNHTLLPSPLLPGPLPSSSPNLHTRFLSLSLHSFLVACPSIKLTPSSDSRRSRYLRLEFIIHSILYTIFSVYT